MIPTLELDRLLAQEIVRRVGTDSDPAPTIEALRSALHVLKGSASMAGHHDLTLLVTQFGQRVKGGEEAAVEQATRLLRTVAERLDKGLPPFDSHWPEPPPGLLPSVIPADQRADYLNAMLDRLSELESIIRLGFGDEAQLVAACRSVHSMKAQASGVGDDVTAWYCHNLEARLRNPTDNAGSKTAAFLELSNHRATLLRLLESPENAFEMLHSLVPGRRNRRTFPPTFGTSEPPAVGRASVGLFPARTSTLPPSDDTDPEADATIRVTTAAFEQFFDHVERIDIISDQLLGTSSEAHRVARTLRDLRHEFVDVQRALGWLRKDGSSMRTLDRLAKAIESIAELNASADRVEQSCRQGAESLRGEWQETRRRLGQLRRTTLAKVFNRCERAACRYAEAESKRVSVETHGGDWSIERSLAERLVEPLLQIVKNAICHGIETPEMRSALGKPEVGRVRLIAERQGEWLRLIVDDDGRGVDLERVRSRAVEQGVLTENESVGLGENELLNLLFVPGLSTRSDAGMIAGRGMGLDLARDVVRRLGGGIRFSVQSSGGVRVTLDLPQEFGLLDVVWLNAGALRLALPVTFTGQLYANDTKRPAVPLAGCLGLEHDRAPALVLELVIPGLKPLGIAVDSIGEFEEVSVRALPPLLANAGPYVGAVVEGDGKLCLVLDAPLVAARAWMYPM